MNEHFPCVRYSRATRGPQNNDISNSVLQKHHSLLGVKKAVLTREHPFFWYRNRMSGNDFFLTFPLLCWDDRMFDENSDSSPSDNELGIS